MHVGERERRGKKNASGKERRSVMNGVGPGNAIMTETRIVTLDADLDPDLD
jgi:hypothetical protein